MSSQYGGSTSGLDADPRREDGSRELEEMRATCHRQTLVIGALRQAVSTLRRGAAALKAENSDLRAQASLRHESSGSRSSAVGSDLIDIRLPLDRSAPVIARTAVAGCLRDRLTASALADARLLVSELVTDAVRNMGASPRAPIAVRVKRTRRSFRIEVEDPGRAVSALDGANRQAGGDYRWKVVHEISERWAMEPFHGGTLIWAELASATDGRNTQTAESQDAAQTEVGPRRRFQRRSAARDTRMQSAWMAVEQTEIRSWAYAWRR